ncbi:MAG: hypothetical protein H0W74_13415 [Sphingosinicella sp.]|nr:hypothetical protein [Sphingosinicella sp.]
MDDSELQSLVSGLITSATQYIDGELSPDRATATNYYKGRPFGNEEPGRSQVVLTEVRDGILSLLPPVLRVLFSSAENPVEFRPRGPEDVEDAEQKTDYVRYVFEDQSGFLRTIEVLKDGLIRGLGVFKWVWDEYSEVEHHKLEGLDQQQIEALAGDDELELTRIEPGEVLPPSPSAPGAPPAEPVQLFDVELTRTQKDGKVRIYAVPPEEFLFVRESRDTNTSPGIFHRTRKTKGELVSMGIPAKELDEHGGDDPSLQANEEVLARTLNELTPEDDAAGKANDKILYVEGYVRIDYDGDGIAELRKICTIGSGHHIVENEPTDELNFAIYTPDPEPHTLLGLSQADKLMDMQKVKSMVLRSTLDSLAASIHPRTWYKEGDANLADVLNVAIGAPIRTRSGPNAVGEFAHTFVGREAFAMLQYCDDIVERRTGQNKGAAGLDANALQSSTQAAVAAAVTASQAQQELVVRIFSETLKMLFVGIAKLLVKHQPRAKMARLRGKWVNVDPRSWNTNMDAQVTVTLGTGLVEEKIQTLAGVAAKQAELLQQLGPSNPIVGLKEYRDTLAQALALRGFKNTGKYFKEVDQAQLDKMAQEAANKPPPETPEMVIAKAQIQIEQMKAEAKKQTDMMHAQLEMMKAKAELELKRRDMLLEDDRQRDKIATDTIVKLRNIEATTGISQAGAIAQIEDMRARGVRSPEEIAPRKRRVRVERDGQGRLAGATVVDEEDM